MPYAQVGENMDYPTAWSIARNSVYEHDPKCSFVIANRALLCDCEGLWDQWRLLGKPQTAVEAVESIRKRRVKSAPCL